MTIDARILPQQFCDAYEALMIRALDDGSGAGGNHPMSGRAAELGKADGKPTGQWPVKSSEHTSIGKVGGPKNKQVGKTSRAMRDEKAFRLRQKIDKRLRAMSREMLTYLETGSLGKAKVAGNRLCTGKCKRIGDGDWLFCANCGGPMRDMDEQDAGKN